MPMSRFKCPVNTTATRQADNQKDFRDGAESIKIKSFLRARRFKWNVP